ncbi:MAG: hypothetical protein HKN04_04315 [Rhodothermaceae bacterium]|nr:hypothetical protein [Rhodothermaceae bacterium]
MLVFSSVPLSRLFALAILALAMGGCDLVERPAVDPLEAVRSFGAPYALTNRLASDFLPDRTGATPALTAEGDLLAAVRYTGGCTAHQFFLNFAIEAERAIIWFVHDDGGDTCEGQQEELIVEALGPAILNQPSIVLIRPEGGEILLRSSPS